MGIGLNHKELQQIEVTALMKLFWHFSALIRAFTALLIALNVPQLTMVIIIIIILYLFTL